MFVVQTVRAVEDDYLVTAMETMQQMTEDIKSSRETIRSSTDQLPYSEEAQGGGRGSPMRSRSAEPPNTNTKEVNNFDNYDSLSFQDALTPSNAADLPPAAITQTPASPPNTEDLSHISANVDALINEAERQNRVLKWGEDDQNEKFLTVEEIITKRRQEAMRKQGLQLVQILRDAEEAGYTSEDVSIALTHCGDKNPLEWLKENWRHMVDTVSTLATNYGQERRVNDVGSITAAEARVALRVHKGNIWAAVTECVEQRQKKFSEIYARGKFRREEVIRALEANDGDADKAFLQLNRFQLQPFLNKIWQPQQVLGHLAKLWHPHQAGEQQQQQQQKQPSTTTNQKQPTATAAPPQPEPQRDTASQPQQPPVPLATTAALSQAPRPTAPLPNMAVPTPLLPTPTTQMVQAGFEYVTTSSDEDDIFENTYANIEPLNKQPAKVEPVYATVIKKSKRENKEIAETKGLQMVEQKPEEQTQGTWAHLEQPKAGRPTSLRAPEERTPSPDGLDLSAIEDEALFSASEVVGLESDEDTTIEDLLADMAAGPYYEYFTAVGETESEDSSWDEMEMEGEVVRQNLEEATPSPSSDMVREELSSPSPSSTSYASSTPSDSSTSSVSEASQQDEVMVNEEEEEEEEEEDEGKQQEEVEEEEEEEEQELEEEEEDLEDIGGEEEEVTEEEQQEKDSHQEDVVVGGGGGGALGDTQQTTPLRLVRKEDVVVHALKAFTHYADLSVSVYSEEPRRPAPLDPVTSPSHLSLDSVPLPRDAGLVPPHLSPPRQTSASSIPSTQSCSQQLQAAPKKPPKYSSTLHVSLSTQKEVYEHTPLIKLQS
ncbi:hypothetical protein Pcinc_005295 [Petrolisthes cinctipes]|uniref:E3 ubiquitin-protein ligase RNF31 UBA-like domain-containing protein n=1 Tax=Petrolisthes cinctipes TaxID=88211 RepID=A0AAE1GJP0_PETCI|nr:hypothetical protein Pcinc_005295 [Petrolisthes cinctipes]